MAVGKYNGNQVKAELYEFEMDKWTVVDDYPGGPRTIQYVMLFIPESAAYYVIGGEDANYSATLHVPRRRLDYSGPVEPTAQSKS